MSIGSCGMPPPVAGASPPVAGESPPVAGALPPVAVESPPVAGASLPTRTQEALLPDIDMVEEASKQTRRRELSWT